ncbi:transcription factor Adf-1-like, partial [Aphis craccivora]
IWKDIATKIGKSTDDTKKRRKNIRDSYSRNKRKPGTGSAASTKKKWSLATHLTFLDQVECERESTCNLTMKENMDVSLDEERDNTSPCEATNDLPTETSTRKRGFSKSKSVANL